MRRCGDRDETLFLLVTQVAQYFKHFPACGNHPAAAPLVEIEGVHELDLGVGIVALAGGGINLAAATDFFAPLTKASLGDGRGICGAPIGAAAATARLTLLDCDRCFRFLALGQSRSSHEKLVKLLRPGTPKDIGKSRGKASPVGKNGGI